jgi:hypothetical protein
MRRDARLAIFGALALSANVSIALLLRHDHRPIVTAASCFDFVVSLPALYYFLVIRAGADPLITLLPVLAAGFLRVAYLAPMGGAIRICMAGLCECGIAWFVLRRGRDSMAARTLRSEISVLRYAFASWWMEPDVPAGGRAFSMHQAGGVSGLFGLVAAAGVVEAGFTHLVVQRWSVPAAWVISALSVYGAVLLIALARAFSLRPIVVTPRSVLIRSGLLWSVEIAPENIAQVQRSGDGASGCLRITGMSEANVFVLLRKDAFAEGFYGRRKTVSSIAISADQPQALMEAIISLGKT